MKTKKTPNAQHRTSNIELSASSPFLCELPDGEYAGSRRRTFDLEDRLLEFAVQIIDVTDALPNTRAGNHIAGQLLRSGTSPYGNHGEVESAESRKDFVHKLRLAGRLKRLPAPANLGECTDEAEELIRIFVASIRTAEKNNR